MKHPLHCLSLLLAGLAFANASSAATIVLAVPEGDWADPASWSPNPPTAADTVVINANRVANVTTDVTAVSPTKLFISNQADPTKSGTVNVLAGGKVNFGSVIVSTNTNTGLLNIRGGALSSDTFIKAGNVDGSDAVITVSGGQMAAAGSLVIGQTGTGRLVMDGRGATVMAANMTVGGGTAGTVEFRLDGQGVSSVFITNYLTAAAGTLVVDGSRYSGDSATIRLVDAKFTNPSSSPFGSIQLTGFGDAYTAEVVYSDTAIDLVVTATGLPRKWAFWNLVDGDYVDTVDWIGWLNVSGDPWVYSYSLNGYLYLPQANVGQSGGWMYILN